jgi:hypothetical protein
VSGEPVKQVEEVVHGREDLRDCFWLRRLLADVHELVPELDRVMEGATEVSWHDVLLLLVGAPICGSEEVAADQILERRGGNVDQEPCFSEL